MIESRVIFCDSSDVKGSLCVDEQYPELLKEESPSSFEEILLLVEFGLIFKITNDIKVHFII